MAYGTTSSRRITRLELAATTLRAEAALERSSAVQRFSRELVEASRAMRFDPTWPRYFVIHGRVDGQRVRASWFRNTLHAGRLIRQRAQVVIGMGETFHIHDEGPIVVASLVDPLAAMLTLIRSCDSLDDATFGPITGEPPEPRASR